MSNYRDDTTEMAVASSSLWGGQKSISEGTAKASDEVLYRLRAMETEAAIASDFVQDWQGVIVQELATFTDELGGQAHMSVLVTDELSISEVFTSNVIALPLESTAAASDFIFDIVRSLTIEVAVASDVVLGHKTSSVLVQDSATASDKTLQAAHVLVVDSAAISDLTTGKKKSLSIVSESVQLIDSVVEANAGEALVIEVSRTASNVIDFLHARHLIAEVAEIDDEVLQDGGSFGQAWTANLRTWATSRYSPFTFSSVAVIDGIAYASSPQGVFALSGGTEDIAASVATGKIDIGQGSLVHPLWAYLEYELDGTAQMDVTQTQAGASETYTYELPAELSGELTNGRFTFGRGLRGRHFSFALRLNGHRAIINDLRVETAPTKRRV